MFERELDETTGIIKITATGHWTLQEVDDHYRTLRAMLTERRRGGFPARVLVDIRAAPRQTAQIETRFGEQKDATYHPGDRISILTGNADAKEHVRTLLNGGEIRSFCSETAAEQWLFVDECRVRTG